MWLAFNIFALCSISDGQKSGSPVGSARQTTSRAASHRSRPQSTRADLLAKRKREMKERMEEAAESLRGVFSYRNQDALIKVTRNTLESIRKRITSSAMAVYIGGVLCLYTDV